jgi:uroporphyrinogen-III synthase
MATEPRRLILCKDPPDEGADGALCGGCWRWKRLQCGADEYSAEASKRDPHATVEYLPVLRCAWIDQFIGERLPALLEAAACLALTSARAAEAVVMAAARSDSARDALQILLREGKVFCVGAKTALPLGPEGVELARGQDSGRAELLAEAVSGSGVAEVLFVCGENRRPEMEAVLGSRGVRVSLAEVYRTEPLGSEELDAELERRGVGERSGEDTLVVFSPAGASLLCRSDWIRARSPCVRWVALGPTTASALTLGDVSVASQPNAAAVMAAWSGCE